MYIRKAGQIKFSDFRTLTLRTSNRQPKVKIVPVVHQNPCSSILRGRGFIVRPALGTQ